MSLDPYQAPRTRPNHGPPLARTGKHAPCPKCRNPMPQELRFTWWGGVVGAKLLSHVECTRCGHHYNGKTGGSNTVAITIYVIVVAVFAIGLVVTVRSGLGV